DLSWAQSSTVNGNLLAIGGSDGVTVADIATPTSPNLQAQLFDTDGIFTNIGNAEGIAWAGSNLVVAGYYAGAVTIISCTNPAAPVKLAEMINGVGGWNNLINPKSVAVSGNLLAIGTWNNAVTLADISNPSTPSFKSVMVNGTYGFTNLSLPSSVALSGSLLVIGAYNSGAVTLVNVADPTNPQKLAELRNGVAGYTNLNSVESVALAGNLLAIGASGAVTLVNVSNPATPVKLVELRNGVNGFFAGNPGSVAISGNRLAIGSGSSVTLVDISNPAMPQLLATATDGLNGFDYLAGTFGLSFAGTNLVACGDLDHAFTILGITTQPVGLDTASWVGIGTTHPAAALDVVGNVLVENANLFDVSANRIALGYNANASGDYSISLGGAATASGSFAAALGYESLATGNYSTALGTYSTASGTSAVALGDSARATGDYSTAVGYYAQATNSNCLVWSDGNYPGATSASDNSVTMRASGGYRLFSNSSSTAGVSLAPGGTAWATISDQNAKKNFATVNGEDILDKLDAVPVQQWNYKWENDSDVPNIGPMAQAFKAAFYPGRDDKSITTLEF
ncbi:MAG TPA: tail fiber domain-containing protein, partial [Verrucomicrobiae bacterium]